MLNAKVIAYDKAYFLTQGAEEIRYWRDKQGHEVQHLPQKLHAVI